MNSLRKAEARLLPDPMAPIRICNCVLTPEDLSRSFYKREPIVVFYNGIYIIIIIKRLMFINQITKDI